VSTSKIEIHAKVSKMGTSYIIYIPVIYNNIIRKYHKKPVKIIIEPL